MDDILHSFRATPLYANLKAVLDERDASLATAQDTIADVSASNNLLAAQVATLQQQLAGAAAGSGPIPAGSVRLGELNFTAPWDLTVLSQHEAKYRKQVGLIHYGQPWQKNDGSYHTLDIPALNACYSRPKPCVPVINWLSWRAGYGPKQSPFSLATILTGIYDQYIRDYATAIRNYGKLVYIRFNHEMNIGKTNPEFVHQGGAQTDPRSGVTYTNTPAQFIQVWRRVVDIFRSVGITSSNVRWIWCPNVSYNGQTPMVEYWPGSSYVDVLALDGYNKWSTPRPETFYEVFRKHDSGAFDSYAEITALDPNKELWICETGSIDYPDGGLQKAAWTIDGMTQAKRYMPKLSAILLYHRDPFRLDSTPAALDSLGYALQHPMFKDGY